MKSATWKKLPSKVSVYGITREAGRADRRAERQQRGRHLGRRDRSRRRAPALRQRGWRFGFAAAPALSLMSAKLDPGLARRCGSSGPAARPCRRRRARPCRARRAAGSRPGTPHALRRRRAASGRCWASESSSCVDLRAELRRFLALRAQHQHPEGDREQRRRRASRRSSLLVEFMLSFISSAFRSFSLEVAARSASAGAAAGASPRRRVTGTGAASKATTISNLAMKLRVRHSSSRRLRPRAVADGVRRRFLVRRVRRTGRRPASRRRCP